MEFDSQEVEDSKRQAPSEPSSLLRAAPESTMSVSKPQTSSFVGKHRLTASITLLNQQIQTIQEELDQLETLGECSLVCKELVPSVESVPDALLAVTKGPADACWDRWFHGSHGSRGRKRWI